MTAIVDTINALEAYYQNNNVFKSVIFCADEEETLQTAQLLSSKQHSVCTITETDVYDDRNTYIQRMRDFNTTSYRIIVVSYQVWKAVMAELEVYVLPEQNLIAFGDLCEGVISYLRNWLVDAKQRGFIVRDDCTIINLSEY